MIAQTNDRLLRLCKLEIPPLLSKTGVAYETHGLFLSSCT